MMDEKQPPKIERTFNATGIITTLMKEVLLFENLEPQAYGPERDQMVKPSAVAVELAGLDWVNDLGTYKGKSRTSPDRGLWVGRIDDDGFDLTNIGCESDLGLRTVSFKVKLEGNKYSGMFKIVLNDGRAIIYML